MTRDEVLVSKPAGTGPGVRARVLREGGSGGCRCQRGMGTGRIWGTLAGATWPQGAAATAGRRQLRSEENTALSQTPGKAQWCHPHFTAM